MSSVKRWLMLAFAVSGILAVWIVSNLTSGILFTLEIEDPLGDIIPLSTIVGLVAGIVTFLVLLKHQRANDFGTEVVKETKKVTWPTLPETRAATLVVIVLTLIISMILGVFDWVFATLTNFIYA